MLDSMKQELRVTAFRAGLVYQLQGMGETCLKMGLTNEGGLLLATAGIMAEGGELAYKAVTQMHTLLVDGGKIPRKD